MTRTLKSRRYSRSVVSTMVICAAAVPIPLFAQTYDLSWYTVDGGGATFSTGGTFQLGGTIGQPDASSFSTPMSGGSFTLVGGFWPAAANVCALPGDMNLDGLRDGADVQLFVNCIVGVNGSNCVCADFDASGSVTPGDAAQFVAALLAG